MEHYFTMLRRAVLVIVLANMAAARAETNGAAAGASPSSEMADLQIAQAGEAAAAGMAASGKDATQARAEVERMFVRLEVKYPRSAVVRDEHGSFLFASGKQAQGFAEWEAAEKLDGNNANVCSHLGYCWMESGDIQRATGYFEKAVALGPNDATSHNMLGTDLYMFRHQLTTAQKPEAAIVERALAEMRKATELEPLDVDFAREYAETFYSIPEARWAEALKAWQHFYAIATDKDYGAVNLARVSLQMKDAAGARKWLSVVRGSAYASLKKQLMAKAAALQAG